VREHVERGASAAGLDRAAAEDLVLAAHELASNSVRHGGGQGWLRSWCEPGAFVVEVSDSGRIDDPLVGRQVTDPTSEHGRGVWMANQLCDLVQLRSSPAGTVVRLFAWLP
jgi:anti-sigma regulatory factor (Ser/Thr protein kinase)